MLNSSLTFAYSAAERLTVGKDGHYHIRIPTFYEFGSFSNERLDYIFDTGAFITVLTREWAALLGLIDKFTIQTNVPLGGFAGSCLSDIKTYRA